MYFTGLTREVCIFCKCYLMYHITALHYVSCPVFFTTPNILPSGLSRGRSEDLSRREEMVAPEGVGQGVTGARSQHAALPLRQHIPPREKPGQGTGAGRSQVMWGGHGAVSEVTGRKVRLREFIVRLLSRVSAIVELECFSGRCLSGKGRGRT